LSGKNGVYTYSPILDTEKYSLDMLKNISSEKQAKDGILDFKNENFWEKINTNLVALSVENEGVSFFEPQNKVYIFKLNSSPLQTDLESLQLV
jgi:hypothetical protein